jgi:hypothetical protein
MRRVWSLALAVILVVSSTSFALAKKKKATHERKDILVTEAVVVKATVEAIDHPSRTITLKGPKGVPLTYRVDHSVKNFDQVLKGDKVIARYLEAVAIYVDKPQGRPVAGEIGSVQATLRGKKPSQFSVKIWETRASVETVNYRKHTLSVKGPEGKTLMFKTDKRVKNLREVKAGDEVVVRYTEALVVAVEK